jgi:hypothetical protein
MDSSDTAKAQVLSVEQSQQNDRQKVLESAVSTVAALRRLLADYERLETERNDFERERARVLLENNTLRKQAKEATDQRELLVRALETLTTRMDAIGASCIEAAKTARVQSFDSVPLVPAIEPRPNEEQSSEATTSSADAPLQMPTALNPAKWPAAPSAAKGAFGVSRRHAMKACSASSVRRNSDSIVKRIDSASLWSRLSKGTLLDLEPAPAGSARRFVTRLLGTVEAE